VKAPAFQFYPADWLSNVKLRRCSPAARGVWIDVMCLMHGSDEYGVLRWPLAEIAKVVNAPIKVLRELWERGVLKGAEAGAADYVHVPRHAGKDGEPAVLLTGGPGPCWYSSRLVRDEWLRQRRGANTRFDADNQPPTRSPTRRVGEPQGAAPIRAHTPRQGDGASSSSTTTSKAKSKAYAPQAALADVDPAIVASWLRVRKEKRLPTTQPAIEKIRREAAIAGLSMQAVLTLCCEHGWGGFSAAWDRGEAGRNGARAPPNGASIKESEAVKFWGEIRGERVGGSGGGDTIDGAAERVADSLDRAAV